MQTQQTVHLRTARDSIRNSSGIIQINFLKLLDEMIRELVAANQEEMESIKQELSLLENASLHIHHHGEYIHFSCYEKDTRKRFGITEDDDRIYNLARRGFLESQLKALEYNSLRFAKLLDTTNWARNEIQMTRKLERFTGAGLDLSRILFTKEQNEWIDTPYTPNPFHPENLLYRTNGEMLMRSKSETIIGNCFESLGLPYRSDDLVTIYSGHTSKQPFKDTYFADFKTPNLLGGITIHEHFGAFQIEKYPDNALKRLNDYRSFNVYELDYRPVKAEEFTWSLEADLQDPISFRRLLRRILLPL